MTKTTIYQGWRYTFDEHRPAKTRWQATKDGWTLSSPSEAGVKKLIDLDHEKKAEAYTGVPA